MTDAPKETQRSRPRGKRIKIGTIVEIPVTGGFAYLQYFYKSPRSGDCVRIFQGIYSERPSDVVALASETEQMITFYPITYALNDGFGTVVGWAPVPERLHTLPLFKNKASAIRGLREAFWQLMNADTWERWKVGDDHLPEEYHHLPTWCIHCYASLINVIELGWTHETDAVGPTYTEFLRQRIREREAANPPAPAPPPTPKEPLSEVASPDPNPLAGPLAKLLTRLDAVMEKHDELGDTEVREQLHDAVWNAFVLRKEGYALPEGFGMYTKGANKRLFAALATFLKESLPLSAGLSSTGERLAAFQDVRIASEGGTTYDEYFGHRDAAE